MKCVDRSLCDFNGVMREFETRLSPEQELLRVPLIVSSLLINRTFSISPPNLPPPPLPSRVWVVVVRGPATPAAGTPTTRTPGRRPCRGRMASGGGSRAGAWATARHHHRTSTRPGGPWLTRPGGPWNRELGDLLTLLLGPRGTGKTFPKAPSCLLAMAQWSHMVRPPGSFPVSTVVFSPVFSLVSSSSLVSSLFSSCSPDSSRLTISSSILASSSRRWSGSGPANPSQRPRNPRGEPMAEQ